MRRCFIPLLLIILCSLTSCTGSPSILDAKSPQATATANFSWLLFGVAAVVFIIVTVLLLLAIIRSRRTQLADDAYPQDRRAITLIIFGGAVVPAMVLLALMALSVVLDRASAAPENSSVNIEVIGHQWWWEVHYPDQNLTTANEIHVPVNQPITIHVTSADVIHSFWIPQLNGKIDMIPGQTSAMSFEANQIGNFRGECAEYCGAQHAHMALMVVSESSDQFNQWLTNQTKPAPAPDPNTQPNLFKGQQAFLTSSCVYCHTIKGTNASGRLGPDLTHIGSRLTIGAGVLSNNPGNLGNWILNSQTIKPGNLMPPTNLNSDQVQAIVAYLQSLQ